MIGVDQCWCGWRGQWQPLIEPCHEKICCLHMRKLRHRSAVWWLSNPKFPASIAILCGCTMQFVSDPVGNPKDRFSRDMAQLNSEEIADHAANCCLLAHLSQRLIGELIGYPWSGVRPSASVSSVRPSFTMLKDLLLRNRLADQSQILCGASLGRGNDILFAASGSHDQDGRHAHIW